MNLKVYDADYNQIDAQLLDEGSESYAFAPDMMLIYLASEKLYEEFMELPAGRRKDFADTVLQRIERYWDLIEQHSKARILQMNFTEIRDAAFGNYGIKVADSFTYQIRRLNGLLQEAMSKRKSVYPVDILSVQVAI
jgi:predicted enzyme involved in methoxymalonyl-ACP biosynthesis